MVCMAVKWFENRRNRCTCALAALHEWQIGQDFASENGAGSAIPFLENSEGDKRILMASYCDCHLH